MLDSGVGSLRGVLRIGGGERREISRGDCEKRGESEHYDTY